MHITLKQNIMGCDAHMYVEYRKKTFRENYWSNVGGRINPGRNYWMFGLIADVRCDLPENLQPKGLPDNLGWMSKQDAFIWISDVYGDDDDSSYCTLEKAQQWAKYGNKIIYNDQGEAKRVEHPDWHSHTWLTTDEFKSVIDIYNQKDQGKNKEVEYEAILALMESLESNECEVRLVIWFDN